MTSDLASVVPPSPDPADPADPAALAAPAAPAAPEQRRILRTALPGPRSQALQRRREAALPGGLGVTLPVFVERAGGGVLVDVDGNHLIDLASGIAVTSVGASAPAVVSRVQEQAARFTHTCFLVTEYDGYVEVAERLNALTPGDHAKRTALFSTGAEAVENAVKIARAATGRPGVVVFDHAYHGRSMMTLAMTAKEVPYKTGFGPLPGEVHRAPYAYPLRWPGGPEGCAEQALAALEELLERVGPETVAAVVVEPVQGEGGFVVPAPGFLPGVRRIARRYGIVLVADEVQAGMGRTGTVFASEHEGIVPDLVCTAKALGGGLPLAAVTGRAELMEAVRPGGLGGTYAGNPLACAAALGVFEMLADGSLLERARRIERLVRDRLEPLAAECPAIAEVRGRGAMMAIELVRPGTLEPDAELARAVAARCHAEGVVALVCGTYGNVIRLLPPLVIPEDLLAEGLDVLVAAVRSAS
ncbi:4-aminobutyrate--2-oxoglutarate transaminase [Peterkaempfera bronchialis]|uniref:(S)-3-amino-2-methylpropionate transaminase n=1 Tax=Peterkaempfera bronchialis TaxID=2126346 RepID=A0A345T323_9ACTN|nr:4-aminobutyrate--2-oxoglutarate transaminase [Peterkaempfera bronchialis]